MQSRLNPYISFRDNTREAMEFYRSVFGGTLDMTTFKEYDVGTGPGEGDKIMHAMLQAPNGMVLMAADTPDGLEYRPGNTISISLSGDDESEAATPSAASASATPCLASCPSRSGRWRAGRA